MFKHTPGLEQLYVVELEDSGQWPMPTWGPFHQLTDAMNWVMQDIEEEQPSGTAFEVIENDDAGVLRTYAVDDGTTFYHIKRLTPP